MSEQSDTILQAQEQLSRALDRARAGEDLELSNRVRDRGERFARTLAGALRMTRIHDLANRAFEIPIRELGAVLAELYELLGPIQVVMVEDQVYVNDIRIRFDLESDTGAELTRIWNRHDVGGLLFHAPVDSERFLKLIAEVAAAPRKPSPRGGLQASLNAHGMQQIQLQPPFRFRLHGEALRAIPKSADEIHKIAAGAVGQVWTNLAAGRALNPLQMRRAVTEMVEMHEAIQFQELAATSRDSSSPGMQRHTIQVTTLSLMIGRSIGLSESQLSDLGVAACYHDAGYGADEDGFPPPFARHTSGGARLMLGQRGFHEARILRMLAALQHHLPYNADPRPSLFARIIRVADDYDSLTRMRYGGPVQVPPFALARMKAASGTEYDPLLLQVFINQLGLFPPGTIMELGDGRWVTSVSGARSAALFSRPLCMVVRAADGSLLDEPELYDLAEGGEVERVIRPNA